MSALATYLWEIVLGGPDCEVGERGREVGPGNEQDHDDDSRRAGRPGRLMQTSMRLGHATYSTKLEMAIGVPTCFAALRACAIPQFLILHTSAPDRRERRSGSGRRRRPLALAP